MPAGFAGSSSVVATVSAGVVAEVLVSREDVVFEASSPQPKLVTNAARTRKKDIAHLYLLIDPSLDLSVLHMIATLHFFGRNRQKINLPICGESAFGKLHRKPLADIIHFLQKSQGGSNSAYGSSSLETNG
jgi:hypothetical protein